MGGWSGLRCGRERIPKDVECGPGSGGPVLRSRRRRPSGWSACRSRNHQRPGPDELRWWSLSNAGAQPDRPGPLACPRWKRARPTGLPPAHREDTNAVPREIWPPSCPRWRWLASAVARNLPGIGSAGPAPTQAHSLACWRPGSAGCGGTILSGPGDAPVARASAPKSRRPRIPC